MPQRKKDPSVRARANKASTAAVLPDDGEDSAVVAPELPQRYDSEGQSMDWLEATLEWWDDLWAAPMAQEYHSSDRHGLFRLAALIDNYWRDPSAKTHSEVRLAQKDYGLTPYDRRRLEWTIEATEKAKTEGAKRRGVPEQSSQQPDPGSDPRLTLVQ